MKKTILYLILNGKTFGGSEKHVVDLFNLVNEEKFNKYLIYSKGNSLIKDIDNNKQNVYCENRDVFSIFKLIKRVKNINPDILHCHATRAITIGRFIVFYLNTFFNYNIRLISTSHGLWLPKDKDNKFYEFLMHFMRKYDDMTIAVSEKSRIELLKLGYKPSKVITIYNGINFLKFDQYREIKTECKNISFIGRFTDQKGIKYLMKALKEYKNGFCFKIYGAGELEKYIKNFIIKNNLKNVSLEGYSNNVGKAFKDSDVIIAPSMNEGFPYTLIEAINCGLPVISTDVGGITEIVKDKKNGIIIKKGSKKSIINSLELIKKMNIEKLSKNSIEISNKFSIDNMIRKIENLYKKN